MNKIEKQKLKEERKQFVKNQREYFKKDTQGFIQNEIIQPTIKYWKETPIKAIGTFLYGFITMYLIFALIKE